MLIEIVHSAHLKINFREKGRFETSWWH